MSLLIAIIFAFGILIKGGFSSTTFLTIGILISLCLFLKTNKLPPLEITLVFLLFCVLYLISSLVSQFSFETFVLGIRPFICFLFMIMIYNFNNKDYLGRVIIYSSAFVAIIGFLAICNVINIEGMVAANRL